MFKTRPELHAVHVAIVAGQEAQFDTEHESHTLGLESFCLVPLGQAL